MRAFEYSNSPWPIRNDLVGAFRHTWEKFAAAGTWLTADERVAIAQEVRNARTCTLCRERKDSLSPFAVEGEHDGPHGDLSPLQVDVVHRLTTDAARLTETWLKQAIEQGLTEESYVEILSVVVSTLAIDSFHDALGFEHEPLPEAGNGEPSRHRPARAKGGTAWVPMVALDDAAPEDADMYGGAKRTGNVIMAMSLVPEAVRLLQVQSAAMYLENVGDFASSEGRALTRPQIELIAGRVSALNDCFY